MRYDLAFFLCCCKSFLGSPEDDGNDIDNNPGSGNINGSGSQSFYALLGVDRDASQDEIKRAYKRQSLQMHPDKLQQRGKTLTEEDQARFAKMKEGYEVLSDPHKRETYDAIGERGMKWIEEPFSVDPQELAHNFAKSSVLDRSKIFAIFVAIAVAVLLLPILICLHVDGLFGSNASWVATMTPLWLWNVFIMFYHSRVIMMGPIPRPDHIPEEEWVDPLPMNKRILSMCRFVLIATFEILVALKLDNVLQCRWAFIFIPLYIWEATTLYKKLPIAKMRIVTVEDLEIALGKPFSEFTQEEKELIGQRYSVVPTSTSPEFEIAQKLKKHARQDMMKSVFRIVFAVFLILQLDGLVDWSWWLVFLPFWIVTALICFINWQSFIDFQRQAAEKDPSLFGLASDTDSPATNYGAVGTDGLATADATADNNPSQLSEEEREQLKAEIGAAGSKVCSKCCYQGFVVILVSLFVAKLQGASFSSFWIISPFLISAGIILCCVGLAIFGITEVPTEGVDFDTGDFVAVNTESSQFMSDTAATVDPELGGEGFMSDTAATVDPEVGDSRNLNLEIPLPPAPEEALPATSTDILQNPISTSDTEIRIDNSTSDDLD